MNKLSVLLKACFVVSLLLPICIVDGIAQELSRDELDVRAKGFYEEQDYEGAIAAYKELLSIYPKDPAYNYYLGRSFLATKTEVESSISCLKTAASRNYRSDVHYFLALGYLRNHQYDEADVSLINFENLAKKKLRKSLGLEELRESIAKAREESLSADVNVVAEDENYSEIEKITPELTESPSAPMVVDAKIPVKEPVVYTAYDILLQQAMSRQLRCDSMLSEITFNKSKLRLTSDANERKMLFSTIAATERALEELQPEADALFLEAQKHNAPIEQKVNENITLEKEVGGMKIYTYQPSEEAVELPQEDEEMPEKHEENTDFVNNFEILETTPYNSRNPIPASAELPEGLIYRIQLGAFGQQLPMNAFRGLSPITTEFISERNLNKYYVGYFSKSKDAHAALEEVKDYGFGDAFLVVYFNKSKISINAAREIEFGQKIINQ